MLFLRGSMNLFTIILGTTVCIMLVTATLYFIFEFIAHIVKTIKDWR